MFPPLSTFSTHGLHPGAKTTALSYASQVPVSGRFFSDASFDLIETLYSGAWATPKSAYQPSEFRGLTGTLERISFPESHSTGNHSRVWLHAVPYRALFAVDRFVSGDGPGKQRLSTSGRALGARWGAVRTTWDPVGAHVRPVGSPPGPPELRCLQGW